MACKHRSCQASVTYTLGFLPVLVLLALIGWTYYVIMWKITLVEKTVGIMALCICLHHLLLLLFVWSFFAAVLYDAGDIPSEFFAMNPVEEVPSESNRALYPPGVLESVSGRTRDDHVLFCHDCSKYKPDRAHHCSVCDRCTLKMDHHCPWINNCVGHGNYKCFCLFLFYGIWLCVYCGIVTGIRLQVDAWSDFQVMITFFVALGFFIALSAFASMHLRLLLSNATTIEAHDWGSDVNPYDMGSSANFRQVFGSDRRRWLLPIPSSSLDGVQWPSSAVAVPATAAPVAHARVDEDGAATEHLLSDEEDDS